MPTTRPEWLEPLEDPRNEQILTAAFDVFCEKGFHAATMLDVAREARVSKETLYARFDSKEGLFYAILVWGGRKCTADLDVVHNYDDPIEMLRAYACTILTAMLRPESLAVYRIAVSESARTPDIGHAFNELGAIIQDDARAHLAQALVSHGHAEIADMAEFYDCFFGIVRGNFHHNVLMGDEPIPTEAEIAARADMVVKRTLKAFAPTQAQSKRAA
ncbi:MAG: TetR/AcrR family transcriptional regulator [Hyphomonadaceae bacterium]